MVYEGARSVGKRPGYPSGKWHPDAELSQGFGKRLIYLWHQRQMRFWCIVLFFVLLDALILLAVQICAPASSRPGGDNGLFISIGFIISAGTGLYILVRSGRAVEGMIVSVSDDGIDRLYTAYYEDGPLAYELEFTAKCKGPAGRMQIGDSFTMILGGRGGFGPQRLLILPRAHRQST